MHVCMYSMFVCVCVCVCVSVSVCVCVPVCVWGGEEGRGGWVGSRQLPPRGEPGNTCFRWLKADSTAVNRVE